MEEKVENMHICGDKNVKRWIVIVLIVLSLFLVAKTLVEFKRIPSAGLENPVYNTITVSGEGEVVAIPDIATVSFSVTNESLSISDAQQKTVETVEGIIKYLKENKIAEKDVKTAGYNIYPKYEYIKSYVYPYTPTGRQDLVGYVVSESVTVKIRDLAEAGKIIGGLGELGATEISGLTFGFDNDDKMQSDARALAIKDAREKAKKLAMDLGVSLSRIISYNDNNFYPYVKEASYGMGGDLSVVSAPVNVPVNPGESKIISNVTITYEIR